METAELDHRTLYRLPWTLPDNGISWLEPTAMCNLNCDGCYRVNEKNSHKSFEEVKHELDVFQRLRKSDCISIAGGDPLLYPEIVKLVAEIKQRGFKPIINSNGKALTKELLNDLKKAGVFGFTFHIDSNQGRIGEWEGKNELELNDLRLYYAEMLAEAGDIACSFNSTVYAENLEYVP
ncbi:MAG: radical SAM protein, partial [Candidatus Hodarchaeales archaeon]